MATPTPAPDPLPATMRALLIEGPGFAAARSVPVPRPAPAQVLVRVERAGICGTDMELFAGTMPYLRDGSARYPLRPGHEWSGRVAAVGSDVDTSWLDAHVTGDTMIGCGHCARCRSGRHHVCADRFEIGIRGGWAGALAEYLLVPEVSLRRLPDDLPPAVAALVEPGGSAWRSVAAAGLTPGSRLCVWGAGTIGLLCLLFGLAEGAVVDIIEPRPESRTLAGRLGAAATFAPESAPTGGYDAVVDASIHPSVPRIATGQVEPGGRVVLVGLADTPATVDSRDLVLRDVTVTGILAASRGLDPTIAAYAGGAVRPAALVDRVVTLEALASLLNSRKAGTGRGGAPKIHVDPTIVQAPECDAEVPTTRSQP